MAKEILFYSAVYPYSAAQFINDLEANKNSPIKVRVNSPGGDVFSTYGMIAKFQEHQNSKEMQVDGIAASAIAYFLCFADKAECLDVSQFLFHRATFGGPEIEKTMDEADKKTLNSVNAKLRAGMEKKMAADKFLSVTGKSYDELFSMDNRIDIILDAQQAKELGLVQKVNSLTAEKKNEIMSLSQTHSIAAFAKEITIENTDKMTAAEFKTANPAEYEKIFKEGVLAEQTRVNTWMVYADVDPQAVATGIKEGKTVDSVITAEMGLKTLAKAKVAAVTAGNAPTLTTEEIQAAKTKEEQDNAKFKAEVKDILKKVK